MRGVAVASVAVVTAFGIVSEASAQQVVDPQSCVVEDTSNDVFMVATPTDPSGVALAGQTCSQLLTSPNFTSISDDSLPDGLVQVCSKPFRTVTVDFYALPDGTSNQEAAAFCSLQPTSS